MDGTEARRRGQTLVEALVALTILTTGFVGIITLLTKSFQLNRISSEETQATYLAGEGVEIMKSIMDYDTYSGLPAANNWGCSFGLSAGSSADYKVAYDTTPPTPCTGTLSTDSNASTERLYFHKDTGFYDYAPGPNAVQSDFTRDVTVTAVSDEEFRVRSKVTWTSGLLGDSVTVEDYLFNWHP